MILRDPTFERSHCGECYALILKLEYPEVIAIFAIIDNFLRFFPSISAIL